MQNYEDLWADIRNTTEHLSDLSIHLRAAAEQARHSARLRQEQDGALHLELLQNLKELADQVRDILWRELRTSKTTDSKSESSRRAAELFALLARIGAAQQGETPSRSFFEKIECSVERALNREAHPDNPGSDQHSQAA